MPSITRGTFTGAIGLLGAGVFGVGLFPNTHHALHEAFSLTAFLFGGIAAVLSSTVTKPPFRVVAILLGATSLLFLFSAHAFYGTFGRGGVERWIAYPVVLWMVGYGSYAQAQAAGRFEAEHPSWLKAIRPQTPSRSPSS